MSKIKMFQISCDDFDDEFVASQPFLKKTKSNNDSTNNISASPLRCVDFRIKVKKSGTSPKNCENELTRFNNTPTTIIRDKAIKLKDLNCNAVSPPSKRKSSTPLRPDKIVRHRKFPGPAGLLPSRASNTSFSANSEFLEDLENDADTSKSNMFEEREFMSQKSVALIVESDSWSVLLEDLGPSGQILIKTLNLAVFPKVFKRNMRGCKIPFLAAMVSSVDCTLQDPILQLKDMTGEVPAILHRNVWIMWNSEISPGSVLVLKNVGIISAGPLTRNRILNITENNIAAIYYSKTDGAVQSKIMNSLPDLKESNSILNEWATIVKNHSNSSIPTKSVPKPSSSPLFNQRMPTFATPKPQLCPQPKTPQAPAAGALPSQEIPQSAFQIDNKPVLDSLLDGLNFDEFFCDF